MFHSTLTYFTYIFPFISSNGQFSLFQQKSSLFVWELAFVETISLIHDFVCVHVLWHNISTIHYHALLIFIQPFMLQHSLNLALSTISWHTNKEPQASWRYRLHNMIYNTLRITMFTKNKFIKKINISLLFTLAMSLWPWYIAQNIKMTIMILSLWNTKYKTRKKANTK